VSTEMIDAGNSRGAFYIGFSFSIERPFVRSTDSPLAVELEYSRPYTLALFFLAWAPDTSLQI
jgi:hypothetical protein